jgi:O-antigen/teichoic acid export membrane protein
MDADEAPQHARKVAEGSFWSLAGNVTFNLISFFYIVLVARVVSQNDLGLFYLSLSVISLIGILDDLALASALLRYVPFFEARNEKGKIRDLLRACTITVTLSAVVLMGLLWWQADLLGRFYHNPLLPDSIRMLTALLILNNLLKLNTSYLQSRSDIQSQQASNNAQNLLKLVFSLVLIQVYGPSFFALAAALLAATLGATILSFAFVSRRTADLPREGGGSISVSSFFMEIVPFGLMLSTVQSASAILSSASVILMGYLLNPSQATGIIAIYSVVAAFAGAIMMLPNSIGSIFLPVISHLFGMNDVAHMRAATATAQRWCIIITIPVIVVLMAFPQEIIQALYGNAYAAGAPVLALFALGMFISSLTLMPSLSIAAMRLVKLDLKIVLAAGIVSIALSILLIPQFGMVGCAFSFLFGSALGAVAYHHYASKLFGYAIPPEAYRLVSAGIMVFILFFVFRQVASTTFPWLVGLDGVEGGVRSVLDLIFLGALTCVSFALFGYLSLLLRCFRKEDVALTTQAMRKIRMPQGIIAAVGALLSQGVATEPR